MNNTIVYCDDPIKTTLSEWMDKYINRISIGKKVNDGCEIYAYSDRKEDGPELQKFARKIHAAIIHSILSEGVTAID